MKGVSMRGMTSIAALALVASAAFAGQTIISGLAHVIDGDGIAFSGIEVRMQGIAAPEDNGARREPGGPESTAHLRALAEGRFVACRLDGTRTRGRPVGICSIDGIDLGEAQVESGHARDCRHFSKGRYAEAEHRARTAGRDLAAIYSLPGYCVP